MPNPSCPLGRAKTTLASVVISQFHIRNAPGKQHKTRQNPNLHAKPGDAPVPSRRPRSASSKGGMGTAQLHHQAVSRCDQELA